MIKDYKAGDFIEDSFLIKDSNITIASNGTKYLSLELQDQSGIISAKKRAVTKIDEEIEKGKIYKVIGEVVTFRDKLQIKIQELSELTELSEDVEKFVTVSSFSFEELKEKFDYYINSVKNINLNKILNEVFNLYKDKFFVYPAASKNHHDYLRGLMEHTLSMCEIAEFMSKHYTSLDYDLLLSGCLLHDIGKVIELSGPICTQYTKEGNLLGHLVIGENIVSEVAKKLNIECEEVLLLKHMIVSHHGKLEYGACVTPATREALMLSFIDDIDAKMKILDKAYKEKNEKEFTERIFSMDNKMFYIYKK